MNLPKSQLFQEYLLRYGPLLMAVFMIAIYVSTSASTIVSVLIGLLWFLSKQFNNLPSVLKNSSVSDWALLLYLCFIVGLLYGDAPRTEAFAMLRKYRELLYIPVLSCFFANEHYRHYAWKAFLIASVLTLITSYAMDFGIIDMLRHKTFTLKSRITHSIFIAFFMFYCAHKLFEKKNSYLWWSLLLLIGIYNLFFVVEGRTGQLVFMALVPLFAIQRFNKKGLFYAISGLIILLALYFNFSDKSGRIHEGLANTQNYLQHKSEKTPSSMGLRYSFWENSLKLVTEKPLLGYGTGGFAKEYQRITGSKMEDVLNPHNEFLLIAVQFGLLGIFTYCGFLFSQYYSAKILPDAEKWLAQGLLITLIVSSLFNSPFFDHDGGHWFAILIALCFAPNKLDYKNLANSDNA